MEPSDPPGDKESPGTLEAPSPDTSATPETLDAPSPITLESPGILDAPSPITLESPGILDAPSPITSESPGILDAPSPITSTEKGDPPSSTAANQSGSLITPICSSFHSHPRLDYSRSDMQRLIKITPNKWFNWRWPFWSLNRAGTWSHDLIAVIGVGYVGEHLVNVFSRKFRVLAFDISPKRVEFLTKAFKDIQNVTVSSNEKDLALATHFLISVPTLLREDNSVDSSFLEAALGLVQKHGRKRSTVVIESSVAVGMTRTLLGPLAVEKQFFAGMSPERVDPGRSDPPAEHIPKVISGLEDVAPGSLKAIQKIYDRVFKTVVVVSNPETAEMMKLYENCQRMVCIAYANEMADACNAHGIDPFEVSLAAATKPFGYMPMTPSLGVGGHCIPVNPYYLLSNSKFPLLKAATEKMNVRPTELANRAIKTLYSKSRRQDYTKDKPCILVVGMGFKTGQSHLVNSPGLQLATSLVSSNKVQVTWADPLVEQKDIESIPRLDDDNWTAKYLDANFDMIIIAFRQQKLDFSVLNHLKNARIEMWCV